MPEQAERKGATKSSRGGGPYAKLPPFAVADDPAEADPNLVNTVIESPQGCRHKYTYDDNLGIFMLSKILPAGSVFPFDFGFVPNTRGGDGDPLDVLVLMDEPVFTGCVVQARLIGVIEAEQTERDGSTMRNDRLIAIALESKNHSEIKSLHQLNDLTIQQIEQFFINYNTSAGKVFKLLGHFAAERAHKLVEESSLA